MVAGALRAALEEARPICVITVIESEDDGVEPGARIVVRPDPDAEPDGSLGSTSLDAEAVAAARELLAAERSEVRTLTGGVRAFIEVLEPPLRLLVCGAGHDAIPLTRAAAGLGWNAIVVDDRVGFLTAERYPHAGGFVHVEAPELTGEDHPDRRTYVRGRDDPQLPAGQGVPALAAGFTGRLHRHAGSRRAHRATVDGAPRRRRHRSPTRTARASTARRAWTSAPKVPRRSRSRSSPRSWPSGAPAAAAS